MAWIVAVVPEIEIIWGLLLVNVTGRLELDLLARRVKVFVCPCTKDSVDGVENRRYCVAFATVST